MSDLWPRLCHVRFRYDMLDEPEVLILSDRAFRSLMQLVRFASSSLVWTMTEPRDGSLPNDDLGLSRLAGVSISKWRRVRPEIECFFIIRNNRWHLDRPWIEIGASTRMAIPIAIQAEVAARQGRICAYCGETDRPLEFDHIYPVSKGGSNDPSNLTLACDRCNRSKGDKTLMEWKNG